ncbi:hypothetical protein [Brevibacillus fulvus]|uniref:Ligand-binding sensor domain-containing protein n=1 Tax=Brevibacillus fulvus TaxID=1125967 RepID=A0A938XX73_9BACL|nr:hypothetical protein [Brevibacillus fulvus]MBM7589541.1 ligand-binding sensor domain-containing protein [Brevibacillus fulvus]
MKRHFGLWLLAAMLLITTGCSTTEPNHSQNQQPVQAIAPDVPGDLTYQDVLQKGGAVRAVAMPDGRKIWLGTNAGLYTSANDGLWALTFKQLEQADVTGWFVNPKQPKQIFVAGNGFVKRSNDQGKSWEDVMEGLPASPDIRSFFGRFNQDQAELFAFVSGGGVYRSTDNGDHWALWLPLDQEVYAADFNPSDQRIYVATQYGLLYQEDQTWKTEPTGDAEQIYSVAVNKQDHTLYIATERGILQKQQEGWKRISAPSPERLIMIASGMGNFELVGIGESAFIYTFSNGKWSKLE